MRNRILTTTAALITSVGLSLTFAAPATSAAPGGATELQRTDSAGDMRTQVSDLEVRMDDAEDRVSALEGAKAVAAPDGFRLDAAGDLRQRVTALEVRMVELEARVTVLEGGAPRAPAHAASGKLQARINTLDREMTSVEARITTLESALPSKPIYAHLPYGPGIGATDWAALTRERIDAGWATGAFIYYPGALDWGPEWDAFVEEFPEGVDLMVSPKALNEAALIDFLDRLPQVLRDRMVIAYFQEPEDNHTTPAARAAFRAKVIRFDELTEPYGVDNGVQMQTYVISNAQAHGGDQAIIDMVPAENVDFFGWSLFDFNGNNVGPQYVADAQEFMADHYAGIDWGITSLGFSVPAGTGPNHRLRIERAQNAENTLDAMETTSSSASSWYDVSGDSRGYDCGVDAHLLPVLVAAAGN
jgi:hypothetical protein